MKVSRDMRKHIESEMNKALEVRRTRKIREANSEVKEEIAELREIDRVIKEHNKLKKRKTDALNNTLKKIDDKLYTEKYGDNAGVKYHKPYGTDELMLAEIIIKIQYEAETLKDISRIIKEELAD